MTILTRDLTLANGLLIPAIGFGTWQVPDGPVAHDAVARALAAGYRHIDTARAYGNESSVARAIADSGVPREGVFVTTKLPAEIKTYGGALASFEASAAALGSAPIDLYLIHAPWPWTQIGSDHAAGNAEAWRAMEELYEAGRVRAIGVSNFAVADLAKLAAASRLTPQVNQIKFHVGTTQDETARYCRDHGILVEAYSPLATGAILNDPQVTAVAERYARTPAQLCLRYVVQKGTLPLPKTTNPARMIENADIDFEINAADMARLDAVSDEVSAR